MNKLTSLSVLIFLSLTACDLCAGEGCDDEPEGCAALNASGCEADPRCTEILGLPLEGESAEDWCKPSDPLPEYVGCADADDGCDEAMTLALDEEGQAWEFANSCVPQDWEEVPWVELATCE